MKRHRCKAAQAGVYDFTLDPNSKHPDGAELFENVISVDVATKQVKIGYNFGITEMSIRALTTANGVSTNGVYIILTATVENDDASSPATYIAGTTVEVLLNDSVLTDTQVIESTANVIKVAVPYSVLVSTQSASETFKFKVKAVK